MKLLEALNLLAIVALIAGFAALLTGHLSSTKEIADVKFAIEQSKKGARFTAADGQALCLALLSAHPEVEDALPDVCRSK